MRNEKADAGGGQQASVHLNITLKPADSLRDGKTGEKARAAGGPALAELLQKISPEVRKELLSVESKVLAWIAASKENAALFTADPMAALQKAAPRIDKHVLAQLHALRGTGAPSRTTIPNVNLASIRMSARPAKEKK